MRKQNIKIELYSEGDGLKYEEIEYKVSILTDSENIINEIAWNLNQFGFAAADHNKAIITISGPF